MNANSPRAKSFGLSLAEASLRDQGHVLVENSLKTESTSNKTLKQFCHQEIQRSKQLLPNKAQQLSGKTSF